MTTRQTDRYPVSFERRRYGETTYTWAYVHIEGEAISLGDPWACLTPPVHEVRAAIASSPAVAQALARAAAAPASERNGTR